MLVLVIVGAASASSKLEDLIYHHLSLRLNLERFADISWGLKSMFRMQKLDPLVMNSLEAFSSLIGLFYVDNL